jgi:hypothetical protein
VPVVATEVGTIVAPGTAGLVARTSEHEKVKASAAGATAPSVMVRTVLVPETAAVVPVPVMRPVLAPVAVHVKPAVSPTKKAAVLVV